MSRMVTDLELGLAQHKSLAELDARDRTRSLTASSATYEPFAPTSGLRRNDIKSSSSSSISDMLDQHSQHSTIRPPLALLGFGFALDAYDLFIMNVVLIILGNVLKPTDTEKSLVSTMALVGSMLGQVVFGTLGDAISHRSMFLISVALMLVGSLASGLLPFAVQFYLILSSVRFLLGFGIGGEYPLSATLGAQTVTPTQYDEQGRVTKSGKTKSQQLSRIFAFQGLGTLTAILAGLVFYDTLSTDSAWRACFLLGAVPCVFLAAARYHYLFRRPKQLHQQSALQPQKTISCTEALQRSRLQFAMALKTPLYRKRLCAAALNWFLLDIVFYANGLFSGTILNEFTHKATRESLKYNAILGAVAVVGYLAAVTLIDRVGRRRLQLGGFLAMAAMYLIAALALDTLRSNFAWFLVVYGLTFFFCNGGPNTTTYIVAAEAFPKEIRATCSGVSAAAGKLGAAVGAFAMAPVATYSMPLVFYICAGICVLGALTTAKWTEDLREINVEREIEAVECREKMAEAIAAM